MPCFPETNEPTPETKSPERRPVLNECNCHRTRLCIEDCEQSDGNGDEDGASTPSPAMLVSETDEDHLRLSANAEEDAGGAAFSVQLPLESDVARDIHAFLARFRGSEEDVFVLDPHAMVFGHTTFRPLSRPRSLDAGSPSSMQNEHGSNGPRSSNSSERRSIRSLSQGPGMAAWADEALGIQLQLQEYLFTDSPLRLTPQRRYCWGLVASHLIVRDG